MLIKKQQKQTATTAREDMSFEVPQSQIPDFEKLNLDKNTTEYLH